MNLYELTRKLVARGCPEHPRVKARTWEGVWLTIWGDPPEPWFEMPPYGEKPHPDDARAIWTCWADEWFEKYMAGFNDPPPGIMVRLRSYRMAPVGRKLEAIEEATRHLEPSPAQKD